MRIWLARVKTNYDYLMFKTNWVSLLGTLVLGVYVVVDTVRTTYALVTHSDLIPIETFDATVKLIIIQSVIVLIFGIRFYFVFNRSISATISVYLSWTLLFLALLSYGAYNTNLWSYSFNSFSHGDPIENLWKGFALYSLIRGALTLTAGVVRSMWVKA